MAKRKLISQAEAWRTRKRLAELLAERASQLNVWNNDHPGGVNIGYVTLEKDWFWGACRTAMKLKHALVVKVNERGEYMFYAVKA